MMKIENNATSQAPTMQPSLSVIDTRLGAVLARFPTLVLAIVFGSVAQGHQRADSDLDIAVAARQALTVTKNMTVIEALADFIPYRTRLLAASAASSAASRLPWSSKPL